VGTYQDLRVCVEDVLHKQGRMSGVDGVWTHNIVYKEVLEAARQKWINNDQLFLLMMKSALMVVRAMIDL
jgi:hypothetical protein